MKKSISLFVATFVACVSMMAATLTVTSNADSGEGSLRDAVAAAGNGDEIVFDLSEENSVITLSSDLIPTTSVSIDGYNNGNGITLTGGNHELIDPTTAITLNLSNLLFLDGQKTYIRMPLNSVLNIDNCAFVNCSGDNGGAIRAQGSGTINYSYFNGNKGSGSYGGGAIAFYNSCSFTINNCTFEDNTASNTSGQAGGGAIVVRGTTAVGAKVVVTNCTFANNTATNGGAVLASVQSSSAFLANLDLINCTFVGNKSTLASQSVGAVSAHKNSNGLITVNMVNCIAMNNVGSAGYADITSIHFPIPSGTLSGNINVTSYNSFYGAQSSIGDANAITFVSSQQRDASDNSIVLFEEYETFDTDKRRPVLSEPERVAALALNSEFIAAGEATVAGFTIPTTDQQGNVRPAVPAVGAVEKSSTVNVQSVASANQLRTIQTGNRISLIGFEGVKNVKVYSATGALISTHNVSANQGFVLPSNNFYILKVGSQAVKVLVK